MKYVSFGLALLFAVSLAAAATPEGANSNVDWKNAEKNYVAALQSTNAGVQASAATFIRKYNLTGATDELKKVLCKECPEHVRMAVAYALVSVGGDDGRKAVEKAMENEENELVHVFYQSILHSNPPAEN